MSRPTGYLLGVTEADLEANGILVTAYTDPSWTPASVAIKDLRAVNLGPATRFPCLGSAPPLMRRA
jgi:hypothetical protein